MPWTERSRVNLSSKIWRLRAPNAARDAPSSKRPAIAFARANGSPAGTSVALRPSSTTSRRAGRSLHTIGRPRAIASITAPGSPSYNEGKTNTSAAESNFRHVVPMAQEPNAIGEAKVKHETLQLFGRVSWGPRLQELQSGTRAQQRDRTYEVFEALRVLVPAYVNDDLIVGSESEHLPGLSPALLARPAELDIISPALDDSHAISVETEVSNRGSLHSVRDCVETIHKVPRSKPIDQLHRFEKHRAHIRVVSPHGVIASAYETAERRGTAPGGQAAVQTGREERRMNDVGSDFFDPRPKRAQASPRTRW